MGWQVIIRPGSKDKSIKHCSTLPQVPKRHEGKFGILTYKSDRYSDPDGTKEEYKKQQTNSITDDEFNIFAGLLRNRITIPIFIKEQFRLISGITPVTVAAIEKMAVKLPPPRSKKLTNKTVVFDLDNTLVYVVTDQMLARMSVPKTLDKRSAMYIEPKEGKPMSLNIFIRPYALEMLKQLSTYYEIIVFTAANKVYGDAVIDVLDPTGKLIDYRLYRENCIREGNMYVKDLRIIDRDLSSLIIVDDSIVSFCGQIENGIFVAPFNGNAADAELGILWIFLRQIVDTSDVRVPISAKYNLPFLFKMYRRSVQQ